MSDEYIDGTLIPQRFMPALGYVAVQHAQMDHAVDDMIHYLARVNHAIGTAFTSAVMNNSTRLEILRRLIITAVTDHEDQERLFSIQVHSGELSGQRNRLMHDRMYFYSPSTDTVGFFRSENLTQPQIKTQPPTTMTVASLRALGDEMFKVKSWLGMYYPMFPDCPHPNWSDDARFPWADKLKQQRDKRRRSQN